jgi:hypothetical protein
MSTLKTNTLSNVAGTASTAIENAINGSAKAWVNFNGTGTVAIRASYNVSSITDNGTGDYTVNFTTAMPDVDYCVVVGGRLPTATNAAGEFYASVARSGTYSTTAVGIQTTGNSVVTARDADYCNVSIFR